MNYPISVARASHIKGCSRQAIYDNRDKFNWADGRIVIDDAFTNWNPKRKLNTAKPKEINKMSKQLMEFSVHTPNFLKEISDYAIPQTSGVLFIPLNIFRGLLLKVAERASKLNDPILNKLMCQLTLYDVADPSSKDYSIKILSEIKKAAKLMEEKEK